MRLDDATPDDIDTLTITVTTTGGISQGEIVRRPEALPFEACGASFCAAGFAPRLADCCAVADRQAVLEVTALAKDGRTSTTDGTVNVGACSECP